MFGGDEVSSLVFDLGTFQHRIGYSGEDSPKCVYRPLLGIDNDTILYNELGLRYVKPGLRVENIMNPNGTIKDFSYFEKIIDNVLAEQMSIDIKEHPLLFSEPSLHNKEYRQKFTEKIFEKYKIPAIYISKSAVLSAFSCGRSTCMVFDSGEHNTYAVPINEGYALQKCLIKSDVAGAYVTDVVINKLNSMKIKINPFYSFKKKKKDEVFVTEFLEVNGIEPSYEDFWKREIARDLKENCLQTSDEVLPYDIEKDEFTSNAMPQTIKYELPDGSSIELIEDRLFMIERVFNQIKGINNFYGYHNMIIDSIQKADIDIKKDLYLNIFSCGGNTLFPGFPDRLQKQLFNSTKQNMKIKVITHPSNTERKFSAWIGGSILSSLGTFHQLWLSKAEFEEHGAMIIERKCP